MESKTETPSIPTPNLASPGGASHQASEARRVGSLGIVLLSFYQLVLTALLVTVLVAAWVADGETTAQHLKLGAIDITLSADARLLLVVALCGALGAILQTTRTLLLAIASHDLRRDRVTRYLTQPMTGAGLALVFYFAIKAGLLSSEMTIEVSSVLALAAVAGLVGMFSDLALLKLRAVAEKLFAGAGAGRDSSLHEGDAKPPHESGRE